MYVLHATYIATFMSFDWQTDTLQIRMKIVSDKKAISTRLNRIEWNSAKSAVNKQ